MEVKNHARANAAVDLTDLQTAMEDQAQDLDDLGSALSAMMNERKSIPPIISPQATQQDDSTMLTTGTMSQADLIRLMRQVIEETV